MPGLHGGDRTQNALRDAREAQDPGLTEADDAATALVTSAEVEGDQAESEEDSSSDSGSGGSSRRRRG